MSLAETSTIQRDREKKINGSMKGMVGYHIGLFEGKTRVSIKCDRWEKLSLTHN